MLQSSADLTKDMAIQSMSSLIASSMSFTSFSVTGGKSKETPGKFIPFPVVILPEFSANTLILLFLQFNISNENSPSLILMCPVFIFEENFKGMFKGMLHLL